MKARSNRTITGIIAKGNEYPVKRIVGTNIIIEAHGGVEIGFTEETLELVPPAGYSKATVKQSK